MIPRPDVQTGPGWHRYLDAIMQAARTGHGLDLYWNLGSAHAELSESNRNDMASFHPCEPRWVATWNAAPADINAPGTVIADADPRLLAVADGPALNADADTVGEWMITVITTLAGHRSADNVDQCRQYDEDGFTTFPDA